MQTKNIQELTRKFVESYGPSGAEDQIRDAIRAEIEPLVDEMRVDALGNLIAHKAGSEDGRRLLLAAHMDEIGVMVTYVDEKGFARFTPIGGINPLTCIGGRVMFADGVVGVIGVEQKRDNPGKIPQINELYLDVGGEGRENCPVQVGDAGVFSRPFTTQGTRWIAKAMDDRISCAILVELLRQMEDVNSPHDLYVVFNVQEEVGLRGARTAAYGIDPDVAIAVDVTRTGDTPESRPMAVKLGAGPAVKVQDSGMIAHPMVRDLLVQRAEAAEIPYQLEVLERGTTDAAAMQLTRAGVPAGCLSIPCRHIHSPSEMVDQRDVENGVRLLVEVARQNIEN